MKYFSSGTIKNKRLNYFAVFILMLASFCVGIWSGKTTLSADAG